MGFGFETTADEVIDGVDLRGRLAVVTGASTGIGLETARVLAAAGAEVVVAARSPEQAAAAMRAIGEQVPDAQLHSGELELGALDSIWAFADWFAERFERLDVLVNNAGVMAPPLQRTAEGFELQFGTNHLGHFLLTNLLLPALRAAAPARVVSVSSRGHLFSDIHWEDPNYHARPYDKWEAYGQSKTANILFAIALDRRLADAGVHAYSLHPGVIDTELARHLTDEDRQEAKARAEARPGEEDRRRKTVAQGAATSVWAAVAGALEQHGGAYLADCQVSDGAAAYARDPDAAQRLWALSEELVGTRFPVGVSPR